MLLITLWACSGPGPSPQTGPLDAAMEAELETSMNEVFENTPAPGMALGVSDPTNGTHWVRTTGLANLETEEPWDLDTPYPIGSVTKTMTTAWILQLETEGVLTIDDPLEQWVSTPWGGQGITLRHLIQHTSGIASYNYVGGFEGTGVWTPQELVDWAHLVEPELQFEPGAEFAYSNTGFVLLGMVGEAATGQSLGEAYRTRFFEPLGMNDTYLADEMPSDLVRGYIGDPPEDATDDFHPTAAWAAGGVISTPSDLLLWGDALFTGDIVTPAQLEAMQTPLLIDGEEVGYGMGFFGSVDDEWGATWGHTGGYSGQLTYLYYSADPDKVVVAMVNSFEADLDEVANAAWIPLWGL